MADLEDGTIYSALTRIGNLLEALRDYQAEALKMAQAGIDQRENAQLCREDIEFRREMAKKGDAEKDMFLKLMFGGQVPGAQPAPPDGQPIETITRRRPRH